MSSVAMASPVGTRAVLGGAGPAPGQPGRLRCRAALAYALAWRGVAWRGVASPWPIAAASPSFSPPAAASSRRFPSALCTPTHAPRCRVQTANRRRPFPMSFPMSFACPLHATSTAYFLPAPIDCLHARAEAHEQKRTHKPATHSPALPSLTFSLLVGTCRHL